MAITVPHLCDNCKWEWTSKYCEEVNCVGGPRYCPQCQRETNSTIDTEDVIGNWKYTWELDFRKLGDPPQNLACIPDGYWE